MKRDVFWNVVPCSVVFIDVSEELAASVIRVISDDGSSKLLLCNLVPTRLNGSKFQKTAMLFQFEPTF
jgi:hypothetical protein